MPSNESIKRGQTRALKFLALAALAMLVWIAHPVGVGLFIGSLLGFTLQPFHRRLLARRWREGLSALVCVLGSVLLTAVAAATFAALFVHRGAILVESVPGLLSEHGPLRALTGNFLVAVHMDPTVEFAHLREQATLLGSRAAGLAAGALGATFSGLLSLLFIGLTAFYVLLHWEHIVHHAELVFPFAPRHTRALFGQFRRVGSSVLRGTVLTGLAQGLLAGIGYWITGVPDPLFFGALTAVASIVPAVGTLLVWIPIGIFLIISGHPVAGVIELAYGALVVGIIVDYVIRPMLVGRGTHVPAVLTFVSMFGGIAVFGLTGLVVGPVLVTVCVAILKTLEEEMLEEPPVAEALVPGDGARKRTRTTVRLDAPNRAEGAET